MSISAYSPGPYDCLLISTADNIGGMERVVCSLTRGLTAANRSVYTAFPLTPKAPALLEWCRTQNVDAKATPAVRDAADNHTLEAMLALTRFVRQIAPRSVNLHYGDNFISLKDVLAVRLAGRHRCVITVHHPTTWDRTNSRKRLMTRLAAQLADAVVVVSEATRQVLLDAGVPDRKLHLIYSGVAAPEHQPTRTEARQRLGIPNDAFLIASLARLEPHKGIADLIEATAQLPDPRHNLLLIIAGDGPERARLEALATVRLGARARFLGRIAEVADLYAAANLFALPSYLEGFGLVYIEAAFYGLPSIGTWVGGVPEAVRNGETGLLTRPGDQAAIQFAIQKLRDDASLRHTFGDAARDRVNREFTETAMATRYATLLWNTDRSNYTHAPNPTLLTS
jgi:glycosyltransferase involved in cell wall biosynthesis